MRVGIIAAVATEASAFARRSGRFGADHDYELQVCGPGPASAAACAGQLIERNCSMLLSWGVAGALDPALRPGDLIIANRLIDHEGNGYTTDPDLISSNHATLARKVVIGAIYTSAQPITRADTKAQLRSRHQAVAVDMESAAIAAVAARNNCVAGSVRAIVDAASFNVPAAALAGLDAAGDVDPLGALAALARRPWELPRMLCLAWHFRVAIATLRRAAHQLTGGDSPC